MVEKVYIVTTRLRRQIIFPSFRHTRHTITIQRVFLSGQPRQNIITSCSNGWLLPEVSEVRDKYGMLISYGVYTYGTCLKKPLLIWFLTTKITLPNAS